jgi:hypothetical protein
LHGTQKACAAAYIKTGEPLDAALHGLRSQHLRRPILAWIGGPSIHQHLSWLYLLGLALPEQLRQPRDVDGDASRLVCGQHLRLPRLGLNVRKFLPVGVPDDITVRRPVGAPWRRDAA